MTMIMMMATAHLTMTGAYGAELEKKFFTDAEKTNFKDALKYVTMLVWNGENIIQASPSMVVHVLNLVLSCFFVLSIVLFMFFFLFSFSFPFLFLFFSLLSLLLLFNLVLSFFIS